MERFPISKRAQANYNEGADEVLATAKVNSY